MIFMSLMIIGAVLLSIMAFFVGVVVYRELNGERTPREIRPFELLTQGLGHARPWTIEAHGQGNGHWQIVDAEEKVFAYVYTEDLADVAYLNRIVATPSQV